MSPPSVFHWPAWAWKFEQRIYMRHNRAPAVRAALRSVLAMLEHDGQGLNIGSGWTRLHPRMVNIDITPEATLDAWADAHRLPFSDGQFRCIVSQEVFEHLREPWVAIREVARVLEPGGRAYIQVPLIIGIHSAPYDFYRFTPYGLRALVESAGLTVLEVAPSVGAGTAAYRVVVELAGTIASLATPRLYRPAKALVAIVASPLRWLDRFTTRSSETHRVPGGVYVIAEQAA
jgi:SAM-dependent methyltransferase